MPFSRWTRWAFRLMIVLAAAGFLFLALTPATTAPRPVLTDRSWSGSFELLEVSDDRTDALFRSRDTYLRLTGLTPLPFEVGARPWIVEVKEAR